MHSPSLYSFNQNIINNLELHDSVDFSVSGCKHLIQLLSLYSSSWKAIKQQSSFALRVIHGGLDESNHKVIRNQFSSVHDLLCLLSNISSLGNCISQKITSGQMT